MIQHHSTYHVEKMMQYRQAEINRDLRWRLLTKQIALETPEYETHECRKQSFWQRWFGKRLTTSMK